jgi:hypothetical protein
VIDVSYLCIDDKYNDSIKKTIKDSNANLNFVKNVDSSLFNGPLILSVSNENLKKVLDLIDDRNESVIVAFQDKSNFRLMSFFKLNLDKIFGFIDLSLDYEYNIPIVKNYLNMNYSKKSIGIEKLSKDLEKILDFTQTELSRVKEMHDRIVKLRTENLKGAKVQIKFMAGEKSGGEFFDFIDCDGEMIIIEAGSDSYVTSSMIISEVEALKEKKNPKDEIQTFINNIVKFSEDFKSKVNYLITVINMRSLDVQYYQRGNSKLFINNELRDVSGIGTLKLKRGEKLFVLSEGALKNWNLHNKESELGAHLGKHFELPVKDFINEFFFELYRHKNSSFLAYDALMCVVEIDQNVIHKV